MSNVNNFERFQRSELKLTTIGLHINAHPSKSVTYSDIHFPGGTLVLKEGSVRQNVQRE